MNTLDTKLGWRFALLTVIFALGSAPRLAPRYYPTSPRFLSRLAAPPIFAFLALACFLGFAALSLGIVAGIGVALIVAGRKRRV